MSCAMAESDTRFNSNATTHRTSSAPAHFPLTADSVTAVVHYEPCSACWECLASRRRPAHEADSGRLFGYHLAGPVLGAGRTW